LRALAPALYCPPRAERGKGFGPRVQATPQRRVRAEIPGRPPTQTRAQAADDPGAALRLGSMEPVACSIHAEVVPRRAVRKVGPRPDLTRSTHTGEPCGLARLHGDGSRSSCSPYRATHQSTGGGRMKNGGSNPPAPGSRYAEPPSGPCAASGALVFPYQLVIPLSFFNCA
jgi:hypothetical protein